MGGRIRASSWAHEVLQLKLCLEKKLAICLSVAQEVGLLGLLEMTASLRFLPASGGGIDPVTDQPSARKICTRLQVLLVLDLN